MGGQGGFSTDYNYATPTGGLGRKRDSNLRRDRTRWPYTESTYAAPSNVSAAFKENATGL